MAATRSRKRISRHGNVDAPVTVWNIEEDGTVLLGDGEGGFRDQASYSLDGVALAMVSEDFNEDGHLDLAVVGTNVSVLLADWGP